MVIILVAFNVLEYRWPRKLSKTGRNLMPEVPIQKEGKIREWLGVREAGGDAREEPLIISHHFDHQIV